MFARRAWNASVLLQDEISRYIFWLGSQTSTSYVFAAANPVSPVHNTIVRYGSSRRFRIDSAFSVNDWTAFVIFITVIGGIGRVEGPIVGTIVFFLLRQTLADLGSLYLLMLGAVAIAVMLLAPKGIWGYAADRLGWQLLPLERRLRFVADARTT